MPGFGDAGESASDTEFATTTTCLNINNPGLLGDICTIDITFTPAMAGARTGTVTITSNVSGRRGRLRCPALA